MIKKNAANIITCTRIIGTIVMIFMPVFSLGFYIAYTYAGISDVADGYVARKYNLTSQFGAKLDSFSDLFFYISMMLKILPYLITYLPSYIMITIYSVFTARVILYAVVWFKKHRFLSNHTVFNKATGFMLFFVPYMVRIKFFPLYAGAICTVAIIAAVYEIQLLIKDSKKQC